MDDMNGMNGSTYKSDKAIRDNIKACEVATAADLADIYSGQLEMLSDVDNGKLPAWVACLKTMYQPQ